MAAIDDAEGQWEPFFYEQADGRIRAYMRNFTKAIPPGTQWRFTAVGTDLSLLARGADALRAEYR